jgi:hypothetical protein
MAVEWMYVDVAATRIQSYIGRTPRLAGQRGASAQLSWATDGEHVQNTVLAGGQFGAELNPAAGEADGLISVRLPADAAPRPVAEVLTAYLRSALPAVELGAFWGSGPTYLEAYRDHMKDRSSPALVSLPPRSDFPALASCAECRAAPAVTAVDLPDDPGQRVCLDCQARYADQSRTRGLREDRPVYRGETGLLRALARHPASAVKTFEELAALGAADTHRNHLATIYADGNAIGAFLDRVASRGDPGLKSRISAAISDATRGSLEAAARAVLGDQPAGPVPVIPHIVGGDDLLVSVAADRAWVFVTAYLAEFRRRMAAISGVPADLLRPVPPTASAGVVFAHTSFPFSRAAELASGRMRDAKRQERGAIPAVAWLDVTRDGEQPPAGQAAWILDDLLSLEEPLRALRSGIEPSGRAALARLADVTRPEVSMARLREHCRRLGRDAVLAPFLTSTGAAGNITRVAEALSLARWWR